MSKNFLIRKTLKFLLVCLALTLFSACTTTPKKFKCTPVIYTHKNLVRHWTDVMIMQSIIEDSADRGVCVEAIYLSTPPKGGLNKFEVIRTGDKDPYYKRREK